MLGRVQPQKSFGDKVLELHVSDGHFLVKVAGLVDWAAFDACRPKLYGTTGKLPSDPLVCFRMWLLEQWYSLPDPQCGAQCADRLSFRRFPGLSLTDAIPDGTMLVRFRKRLVKTGIAEKLFAAVLAQVEAAGVTIKRGTLVNATVVPSARKAPPKGEMGGDVETSWTVKGGRAVAHRFKAHVALDEGSQIVRAIEATTGSTHDPTPADGLIAQAQARAVYPDAAYCDKQRRHRLRAQGIGPRIRFNPRGGGLISRQRALNIQWSKVRAGVKRILADWKERRSLVRCRHVGLTKSALHFTLLAMAHNLRRWSVPAA